MSNNSRSRACRPGERGGIDGNKLALISRTVMLFTWLTAECTYTERQTDRQIKRDVGHRP